MRGFESHVFRHKMQETLFSVFLFVKKDESYLIILKMNFLEMLENNFSKKISKLLFILYNSVVKWD